MEPGTIGSDSNKKIVTVIFYEFFGTIFLTYALNMTQYSGIIMGLTLFAIY